MSEDTADQYYGYMLVTVDPELFDEVTDSDRARTGDAYDLVKQRLRDKRWPLFRNTRLRTQLGPGSRLLFYVGGKKSMRWHVVASGSVKRIEEWSFNRGPVDPVEYATDLPSEVAHLENVQFASSPKCLKDLLPSLDLAPPNLKYWGVVLQGGCTGLSEADWNLLTP